MFTAACSTTAPKTNTEAAGYNTRLALNYLQQGDVVKAKSKMLLALQQAPNNPVVLDSMGYLLEKTGESKSAENYYLKALKLAPKDGRIQNNYGTYLCRHGRYKESIKHFVLATEDPNYLHIAAAYDNAGRCALKIPDKKLADTYFKRSSQVNPASH